MNLSFARRDYDSLPEAFLILWRAHLQGTVVVAASGDQSDGQPHRVAPANVPFVLGVGGPTWEGMFWDRTTTCYGNGNGTVLGPGQIDICAPASGLMATTSPLYSSETSCDGTPVGHYRITTGQASGASAMTAGAVGLIQSHLLNQGLPALSADDMVVLLEATAYPFRVDPASPEYPRDCPIELCPREYYGRGILNLRAAMDLAEQVAQGGGIDERIARKDAPYV